MKFRIHLPALLFATAFAGAAAAVLPSTVLAAPKKAPCAVCVVREGAGPEPVQATTTYQGKEYSFCSEKCRTEFLKDPSRFVNADKPRPAPAFSLKNLNGETVSLGDYKGKVILLDFWATFCSPCIKEMPKLQKLNDQYAGKGFAVLGLATDEEGAPKVAPAVAKIKVKYPILIANPAAWQQYDVQELPALFLIDRQGQIVKRFGGKTAHKTIEQEVTRLLEAQP